MCAIVAVSVVPPDGCALRARGGAAGGVHFINALAEAAPHPRGARPPSGGTRRRHSCACKCASGSVGVSGVGACVRVKMRSRSGVSKH